jgi:hypothetical protein
MFWNRKSNEKISNDMKANKLERLFNDFGIPVYRTKQDGVGCAELNTYTAGGVNMIVWLNPFTVESFREWVDNFDIDEEIETHRHDRIKAIALCFQ